MFFSRVFSLVPILSLDAIQNAPQIGESRSFLFVLVRMYEAVVILFLAKARQLPYRAAHSHVDGYEVGLLRCASIVVVALQT